MRLRRFEPERLPRVSKRHAAVVRAAAAHPVALALDAAATVASPGMGAFTVTWRGFHPGGAEPDAAAFDLLVRGERGRLTLDSWLALRLVASLLGAPGPRLLRPLAPVERGVLASVLVGGLRALGLPIAVELEPPVGELRAETVPIAVGLVAHGSEAMVRLDAPLGWVASLPRRLADSRAGRLATEAAVELARTEITRGELADARPGDAVVFDQPHPAPGVSRPPARLRIGPYRAAGELTAESSVRLLGPFQEEMTMTMSTFGLPSSPPAPAGAAAPTQVLASAPVEVVAELGRITMTGDQVLGLAPGSIVELPAGRAGCVELRVGGALWARGELVDVDGQLGVRVLELVR